MSLMALMFNNNAYSVNRCLEQIDHHVNKTQLNLAQCGLTSADTPFIMSYLKAHPNLKSLNLHANNIGSSISSFAQNTSLLTLNVSNNDIKGYDIIDFANNRTLQHLDLSGNSI